MSNILDVSTRVLDEVEPEWFVAMASHLRSLGKNYEPINLADAGLTYDEPHSLGFILPISSGLVRGIVAEFQRGEEPEFWFDGHVQKLDGFSVPAVVVKVVRAIGPISSFSLGETEVCLVSQIPQHLIGDYERALHLPEIQIIDTRLNVVMGIPG